MSPSFDRLDNSKPYTFDNLELVTWGENKRRGHEDVKNGTLKRRGFNLTPIIGTNIKTGEVVEYISQNAAKRDGFNNGHINSCLKGRIKTTSGYRWEYKQVNK
jgi:hypothetical protein